MICEADRPRRGAHRPAGRRDRLRVGRVHRSCPACRSQLDEDGARKVFKLIDALEDCDDVQNVYANFDVTDEILEAVGAE